ncbi:MAG: TRAP transporter small permease subunit [Proteobacteria bacterium]|nr:TRAP transporter small permease subunit [Pseudomonadota bacterium]
MRADSLIDRCSDWLGRTIAWLTLAMVTVTLIVVILRYVFGIGLIWLQESITWMHAVVFMLGASYALRHEDHVRVDVFYRRASPRQQGWVDALGIVLLLLPLCAYILYTSYPYVAASFAVRESSREANGLAALFLLKAIIPLMAILLGLQAVADLRRALVRIRQG